jgi:signal transduction histidine kinase
VVWPSYGQEQQKIYSTEKKIVGNPDTAAFWQLTRRANKLRFKAPDSCLLLYQEALNKSKSTNYIDGIAEAMISISLLYHDKGDIAQSMNILRIAKPYCEASTYRNGHYLIYLNNNLAGIYTEKNISDSAAYYYFESLKIIEQKKSTDTSLLLMIYGNLGGLWVNEGQFDLALKYLMKANDIAIKVKDDKQRGEIYMNIAAVYEGKHLYDSAIWYGKEALISGQKRGDTYLEKFASYQIGSYYLHKGQAETAIGYLEDALEPDNNVPMYLKIIANSSMAKAYHQLKKYKTAEEYYFKVLNLNQESNYKTDIAATYNDLASLYADIKDYKSALKYKDLSSALKDSALNAERIQATSQMEVKYRMSEKDKQLVKNQLLLTQQESKIKQKNIWLGSILGGLLLLSALSFTIYTGEKRKRKLQQTQMAGMQKEQEIAQLKAKLNGGEEERIRIARELHDGIMVQFSSVKMNLSCILDNSKDPVEKNVLNNIVVQLDNATRELRKSAHNLMPDMLLEEGLTEAVHYFLSGLKQGSGMDIEFHQYGDPPKILSEYELMLYRIIQELSQNAIKHSKATKLLVQLNYRENMLSITVEDNGIGFAERSTRSGGIGLKNIRSRVLSLNGNMEINSNPGVGSTIYIEFDIQNLK